MGNISIKSNYIITSVLIFFIISNFTISSSADEINILCSNSILADFTSNLLKENVSIEYIMPSGVCPAFYDTTPSDIYKIINADIIISFGSAQKEPWLSDLLTHNPNHVLIECKDLGEWNIPSGAKEYVKLLKDELSSVLPEKNGTIYTNAEIYINQINEKSQELIEMIENSGHKNKKVICMQWQKDFVEWVGIIVSFSYGPPQGISVQDELNVISAASEADVYAIVDNLQSGTDFGANVASETGLSHVIFTNFPDALPGTDTYLEMITYNTVQLIDGIESYEYKKGDIAQLKGQIENLEIQRYISFIITIVLILIVLVLFVMYKRK
jgi:ABC-type Zn uptake system ZnuABC Zn-binding protein ZnuA